ncbi:class D beta-lactamase [Alphaproteobacteria bacterium KMM 3653]|uniref:Class D beta-lactamase n=1 Tax=Harenicola maris TaxID=2841044 RepID=A0AAP2CNC1_9RHOB|nr:class D beta-lactamase [Harenicola maris]
MRVIATVLTLCAGLGAGAAGAKTLCSLVVEADGGQVLHEAGGCDQRVTPASTFKLALAVMGFDAGALQDAQSPRLPFRKGYAEWGGDNWRQATDPQRWMTYSVVWFSQQITPLIGIPRIEDYLRGFGYGNGDFSGDLGQSNGLERAWLTSSLQISPREQAAFAARLVGYDLPVTREAVDKTVSITYSFSTGQGWQVWGKSGTAYPRTESGRFDYARGWGWFVGWAKRGDRTVSFAYLLQDEARQEVSPGRRAQSELLAGFDAMVAP